MRGTQHRRGSFLKGCLITLGILAVLGLAAGIYAWTHWKIWAADLAKAGARGAFEQMDLPDEQKQHILARIDSLADDWKSGKVSGEQVANVFQELVNGPVMGFAMVEMAEKKYIKPSALSEKEKKDGRKDLERLAHGIDDKSIPQSALQEVLDPVETTGPDGKKKLKDTLTTEELKAFLAAAKKKADDAKVPDKRFEVDVAKEVDKAIDKALAQPSSGK